MNSPTGSITRSVQRSRRNFDRRRNNNTPNNLVVIDSDDDNDDDGDQKPAAKPSSKASQKSESAHGKDKCIISLLDSDEENEPNGTADEMIKVRSRDKGGINRMLGHPRDKTTTSTSASGKKYTPSKLLNSPSRTKKRSMDDEAVDRELAFRLQCAEDHTSKSNSPSRWKKRHRDEEDADRMLAEKLQREESKASKSGSHSASADRKLAQELQRMEDEASRKASPTKERNLMAKSTDGKAVLAVQEIIALVRTTKEQFIDTNPALKGSIEAVTIDDMVFMAKNMLEKQKEFIDAQLPGDIDIGYHYTDQRNIVHIRTHGLLTSAERQSNNVVATPKGSVFGDGIYTANNGTNFSAYGDTGLIVARLKGKMVRVPRCLVHSQVVDANTIIGDKMMGGIIPGGRVSAPTQFGADGWPINDSYHEIVLRSSTQCLPMVKFDRALRNHKAGKDCIRNLKYSLQMILDRLFNQGLNKSTILSAPLIGPVSVRSLPRYGMAGMPFPSSLPPHLNSQTQQMQSLQAVIAQSTQALMATIGGGNVPATVQPTTTPTMGGTAQPTAFGIRFNPMSATTTQANNTPTSTLHYVAPKSLSKSIPSNALIAPPSDCNMDDDCAICQERLEKRRCVALKVCNHVFHKGCIKLAFQSKSQCPICRVPVGAPQGKSPSGTMSVSVNPVRCSGFQCDTLVISYNILAARQLSYHDNPGVTHGSKVATAYVPNNEDGVNLLKRLKFAFKHGLTFTVGTSMTSGMTDQCTWSSIHHKTSPSGSTQSHGFPDPEYFRNCNGELDGVSVPPAQALNYVGNVI